ncbi:MAG: hypothetical protein H7831_09835 [Magnetococcus sp. WYHC-3]
MSSILEGGFLHFVQTHQPRLWALIQKTAQESGLIVVDEAHDAITATNRLLWTNPVLHDCIATLVDQWTRDHETRDRPLRTLLTPKGEA